MIFRVSSIKKGDKVIYKKKVYVVDFTYGGKEVWIYEPNKDPWGDDSFKVHHWFLSKSKALSVLFDDKSNF